MSRSAFVTVCCAVVSSVKNSICYSLLIASNHEYFSALTLQPWHGFLFGFKLSSVVRFSGERDMKVEEKRESNLINLKWRQDDVRYMTKFKFHSLLTFINIDDDSYGLCSDRLDIMCALALHLKEIFSAHFLLLYVSCSGNDATKEQTEWKETTKTWNILLLCSFYSATTSYLHYTPPAGR